MRRSLPCTSAPSSRGRRRSPGVPAARTRSARLCGGVIRSVPSMRTRLAPRCGRKPAARATAHLQARKRSNPQPPTDQHVPAAEDEQRCRGGRDRAAARLKIHDRASRRISERPRHLQRQCSAASSPIPSGDAGHARRQVRRCERAQGDAAQRQRDHDHDRGEAAWAVAASASSITRRSCSSAVATSRSTLRQIAPGPALDLHRRHDQRHRARARTGRAVAPAPPPCRRPSRAPMRSGRARPRSGRYRRRAATATERRSEAPADSASATRAGGRRPPLRPAGARSAGAAQRTIRGASHPAAMPSSDAPRTPSSSHRAKRPPPAADASAQPPRPSRAAAVHAPSRARAA